MRTDIWERGVLFIVFVDFLTPLDDRLLLPLFVLGMIGLACLIGDARGRIFTQVKPSLWVIVVVPITVAFVILYGTVGLGTVVSGGVGGQNFADAIWRNSPTLAYLESLGPHVWVITNQPEITYLYTQQPTSHLPLHFDPSSLLPNTNYLVEINALRTQMAAKSASQVAVIVYWRVPNMPFYPSEAELRALSLDLLFQSEDGAIYRVPNP